MTHKIAEKKFTASLYREGSWGARDIPGEHECTMTLYQAERVRYSIEWDIPSLEETEDIGLWFEVNADGKLELVDYDGIMSLPEQAIELLEEQGFVVGEDFKN